MTYVHTGLPILTKTAAKSIAKLQTRILSAAAQVRQHKESVTIHLNAIDRAIAFDESLKNEQQRKGKRSQLLETDIDYVAALHGQRRSEECLAKLEIELEQRRSEFAILKLQARERIANLEMQHAAAA